MVNGKHEVITVAIAANVCGRKGGQRVANPKLAPQLRFNACAGRGRGRFPAFRPFMFKFHKQALPQHGRALNARFLELS